MYVCMDVCMYVCVCVCIYMHQYCNITTNVWDIVHKYLCNFITELHYLHCLTGLQLILIAAAAVFQRATAMSTDQSAHSQFPHDFLFHSVLLDVIAMKHITLSADSSTLHCVETRHYQMSSLNSV